MVNRRNLFKLAVGAVAALVVKPLAALAPSRAAIKVGTLRLDLIANTEPFTLARAPRRCFHVDELQWLNSTYRLSSDGMVWARHLDRFQLKDLGFSQLSPGDNVLIFYGPGQGVAWMPDGGVVTQVIHSMQDGLTFDIRPNGECTRGFLAGNEFMHLSNRLPAECVLGWDASPEQTLMFVRPLVTSKMAPGSTMTLWGR